MSLLENGKPDRRRKIDVERQRDDPAQFSLLSDDEKAVIRQRAKDAVRKELEEREEKALYDSYLKEEREASDPKQQLVPIYLTLAGHAEYLMLDGVQYFHERLHYVTPVVFATLAEMQARGWAHEDETEVRDVATKRRARPPAHVGVGNFQDNRRPRDIVTSSTALQGTSANAMLGLRA